MLSDVFYSASLESSTAGETAVETFSLVKLVSTIVMRETAPLRKEIEIIKGENKKLQEELDAIKAEKEALAAVSATDAASPSANIESALAPY